jgi:hypothetical protein
MLAREQVQHQPPKPENSILEIRNPKPETQNPKPEHLTLEIRNPNPETRNLNSGRAMLAHGQVQSLIPIPEI